VTPEVQQLVARRAQARADKDYAASDELRDAIAALGWVVRDTADGQVVTEAPPYPVLRTVRDVPEGAGTAVVALLVEGWPEDVRACVGALLEHTDVDVVLLENGPTDAGAVVHELAQDPRVAELHVEQPAGWADAQNALVRHGTSSAHVLMDPSTILTGDALRPLLERLAEFAAAGWRGVRVDDGWLSFSDAPAGEVEALLGYLVAVRRDVALEVPLPAKARFYRNADLEWSFLLRERGHRLVAVDDLPVRQARHRGYHDSDPAYRDRESKRTYDRFLQRFRGRDDLRIT
jgi:GT2 family glycosyltransferase